MCRAASCSSPACTTLTACCARRTARSGPAFGPYEQSFFECQRTSRADASARSAGCACRVATAASRTAALSACGTPLLQHLVRRGWPVARVSPERVVTASVFSDAERRLHIAFAEPLPGPSVEFCTSAGVRWPHRDLCPVTEACSSLPSTVFPRARVPHLTEVRRSRLPFLVGVSRVLALRLPPAVREALPSDVPVCPTAGADPTRPSSALLPPGKWS